MVNMRVSSPLTRMFFRPVLWDDEDMQWPSVTMTEGVDVYEEDDKVVVKAAVPGVPADQVDVTFEDGVLRIKARYEETQEEKDKRLTYRSDRVTSFDYTTTLPRPVDASSMDANVVDGVVVVTAKIAEAAKPKKIAVKKAGK